MGCGGSKLNPEHEAVSTRLYLILRHQPEEIRARRNEGSIDDLSKNELIGDVANEHSSTSENSPDPSFHHTQDCPPTLQKISTNLADNPSKLSLNQEEVYGEEVKGSVKHEITQFSGDKAGNVGDVEVVKKREEAKGSEEEGKEEETATIDDDMLTFGSPSFRVYCTNSVDQIPSLADNEEFDGCVDADNIIDFQRISTSDESVSSNEISVKHRSKKGIKRMYFKKMIPKGGKNMFNMQSFYNFPCSSYTSHHNSHFLQKVAA